MIIGYLDIPCYSINKSGSSFDGNDIFPYVNTASVNTLPYMLSLLLPLSGNTRNRSFGDTGQLGILPICELMFFYLLLLTYIAAK